MKRIIFLCLVNLLLLATLVSADSRLPFALPKSANELPATALVHTEKGDLELAFYRDEAPITVANFVYLAEKGFYNGVRIHEFTPGFIVQTGDPKGTGRGGPGYKLPPEFSSLKHQPGTIGMARQPGKINPERLSHGSQFYITLIEAPHLDGLYTIFGRVINGMDVVHKLRLGDRILNIKFPKEWRERNVR